MKASCDGVTRNQQSCPTRVTSLWLKIEPTDDRFKDRETRPLTQTLIFYILLPPKIDVKGVFRRFSRARRTRLLPLRIIHLLCAWKSSLMLRCIQFYRCFVAVLLLRRRRSVRNGCGWLVFVSPAGWIRLHLAGDLQIYLLLSLFVCLVFCIPSQTAHAWVYLCVFTSHISYWMTQPSPLPLYFSISSSLQRTQNTHTSSHLALRAELWWARDALVQAVLSRLTRFDL